MCFFSFNFVSAYLDNLNLKSVTLQNIDPIFSEITFLIFGEVEKKTENWVPLPQNSSNHNLNRETHPYITRQ